MQGNTGLACVLSHLTPSRCGRRNKQVLPSFGVDFGGYQLQRFTTDFECPLLNEHGGYGKLLERLSNSCGVFVQHNRCHLPKPNDLRVFPLQRQHENSVELNH